MPERIDPELVEAAYAYLERLFPQAPRGAWNVLSARRRLSAGDERAAPDGDEEPVEDGDELAVFMPAEMPIEATAASDWRLVAPYVLVVRGRKVDGRWTIRGFEAADDWLETMPPPAP